MKILIQDFDAWPAVAEPAVWRELLDCTHLTPTTIRAKRCLKPLWDTQPQSLYPSLNPEVAPNPGELIA